MQALNERRSVATEVTPEAYNALVETLRVFLDGCSPRSQRSRSRNRSRSGSRSRSSSRSGVDEPSAAGVIAMNKLSSSSSSSSLSSFPLGGAFVGSRGEVRINNALLLLLLLLLLFLKLKDKEGNVENMTSTSLSQWPRHG